VVWKYSVSYDAPKGAKRCSARVVGVFLTPP
jgi:hypothetical protein